MTERDSRDPIPTVLKVEVAISERLAKKKVAITPKETSSTLGPANMGSGTSEVTATQSGLFSVPIAYINTPSRVTGFYGRHEEHRQHETWQLLRHLSSRFSAPWLYVGDYNEILVSEEKQGRIPKPLHLMLDFREALSDCSLIDLGFQGNICTWSNGRESDNFVQARLDLACATLEWREQFPHANVTHLHSSDSDHVQIMVSTHKPSMPTRMKKIPHRFEEKWVTHPTCEDTICEAWVGSVCEGSPMFQVFEKIKQCRQALVRWSHTAFGIAKERLQEKHKILEELANQNKAENNDAIRGIRADINSLLHQEEVAWRQRSRSIWLPADVAEQYFKALYTSSQPTNIEAVLDPVDKLVTPDMNHQLLQPYTPKEIKQALFQMHPSKSLGPDGNDVVRAVLSVLNSSHLLHKMNYTHIILIPKKKEPQYISDYFPINLGNVVSRLFSKVLANHIKLILPNIISDAQSAFVPDRLITDNTTVAFELLHRMRNKRKGKRGQMAMKSDISKAYGRVEWLFLRNMMTKLGFDDTWIRLAMETVCTASYSILINGEPRGLVKPTCGIKQGDPLSPYLFLLCAEGLSAMLRKAEANRSIKGVVSCQHGVTISHLLFADDSLLFCQATVQECQVLLNILSQYESASGQAINRQKTSLFFDRNTRQDMRDSIKNLLEP
ncbi:uncharacterized protein LOC142644435 [Castanea sativa]|uniref:uncharacterized protein LOC142644435 n=1 Tax=Castanea sativa TaxID=21020 RepID=UPI003F652BDE